MTNYPSFAHAAAAQNCQQSYINWQLGSVFGGEIEQGLWEQYQKDCKVYLIVTGKEYLPVLWEAKA